MSTTASSSPFTRIRQVLRNNTGSTLQNSPFLAHPVHGHLLLGEPRSSANRNAAAFRAGELYSTCSDGPSSSRLFREPAQLALRMVRPVSLH